MSSWSLGVAIMGDGSITGGDQIFKYDPQTSVWTEGARRVTEGAIHSSACALNGRIYIIGTITVLNGS